MGFNSAICGLTLSNRRCHLDEQNEGYRIRAFVFSRGYLRNLRSVCIAELGSLGIDRVERSGLLVATMMPILSLNSRIRRAIAFVLALQVSLILHAAEPTTSGADEWPAYLGDSARTHYSTLDQIHKGNVARLEVAWSFDTCDEGEFQSNNLIVDGVLYAASPARKVIALICGTWICRRLPCC